VIDQTSGSSGARDDANGKRRPLASLIRRFALKVLRRIEGPYAPDAAVLDFRPPVRDAHEAADLSGRVGWYLPARTRLLPVYCEGASGREIDPSRADYLEPGPAEAQEWAERRPAGDPRLIFHRLTAKSSVQYLRNIRRSTLADPTFAPASDESYFELARVYSRPGREALLSVDDLLGRAQPSGSVLVLGTGPSASEVDDDALAADVRITCNSAVRDRELLQRLRPTLIAFSDPVFHYGPSRYAAQFRRDLRRAVEETDATFVTSQLFVDVLLSQMPEIASRLLVLPLVVRGPWRWPTADDPSVRLTGNVLTNLMLPCAFALGTHISIAGCDGRASSERYFWKHNPKIQYGEGLMQSVVEAHPAFFRYRVYADYYAGHCKELESFCALAEGRGRTIRSVTHSFIPALVTRTAQERSALTP
jgi:hypothetical protein